MFVLEPVLCRLRNHVELCAAFFSGPRIAFFPAVGKKQLCELDPDDMGQFLEDFGEVLGTDWKQVARQLGLTELKISRIDGNSNNANDHQRMVECLDVWRKALGSQAQYEHLLWLAQKVNLSAAVKFMEEHCGGREAVEPPTTETS